MGAGLPQIAATQSTVTLVKSFNQTWGRFNVEDIVMCANGSEAWVASIGPGSLDDLQLFRITGVNGSNPTIDTGSFIMFGDNDFFGPGPGLNGGTGLPAGTGPRGFPGMAINTRCDHAYVPNFFLDSVMKVNLEQGVESTSNHESGSVHANDGTIVWPENFQADTPNIEGFTIIPPDSPLRSVSSPVDAQLNAIADSKLVVSSSSGDVYVLDADTGNTLAKVTTGGQGPGSVAVVGSYALVAQSSRDVACVDLTRYRLGSTIGPIGIRPYMVVANGDGSRAYVSNQSSNSVSVLAGGGCNKRVVATVAVGNSPRHIALSLDNRFLYVSNALDNTVSVIDTRSLEVVETIDVAAGDPAPIGVIALSNNNRYLYVFYEGGRSSAIGRFQIKVYDVSGLYRVRVP